jgi:hypothetical protein
VQRAAAAITNPVMVGRGGFFTIGDRFRCEGRDSMHRGRTRTAGQCNRGTTAEMGKPRFAASALGLNGYQSDIGKDSCTAKVRTTLLHSDGLTEIRESSRAESLLRCG